MEPLPYDLWTEILDYITSLGDLANCVRTCRMLQEIGYPLLYHHIVLARFREYDSIPTFQVLRTISARPDLRRHVRSAVIHLQEDIDTVRVFNQSPIPYHGWASSLEFANLTSFEILAPHYRISDDLWNLLINTSFELMPNISTIKLSFNACLGNLVDLAGCPKIRSIHIATIDAGFDPHPDATLEGSEALQKWLANLQSLSIERAEHRNILWTVLTFLTNADNLTHLSIPMGHTYPSRQLLTILDHVPNVESLFLSYNKLIVMEDEPSWKEVEFPVMSRLEQLEVIYQGVSQKPQFQSLFGWIAHLTLHSPLKELTIIADDHRICKIPMAGGLIPFVSNLSELRVLRIPWVTLNYSAFQRLASKNTKLRKLECIISWKDEEDAWEVPAHLTVTVCTPANQRRVPTPLIPKGRVYKKWLRY